MGSLLFLSFEKCMTWFDNRDGHVRIKQTSNFVLGLITWTNMMTFMYQAVSVLLDASPHLWEGKLVHPHGPLYSSSGHHEIFELSCTDIS